MFASLPPVKEESYTNHKLQVSGTKTEYQGMTFYAETLPYIARRVLPHNSRATRAQTGEPLLIKVLSSAWKLSSAFGLKFQGTGFLLIVKYD